MKKEKMTVMWNDFKSRAPNTFKQLWNDKEFADVTLSTVDDCQITVHKVILSSCSEFFKNILLKNPHQNPLLYLKDVKHKYLMMVMQFIYLGECDVVQEDLDQFLNTGKELGIKGLMETLDLKAEEDKPFLSKMCQPLVKSTNNVESVKQNYLGTQTHKLNIMMVLNMIVISVTIKQRSRVI